jgi:hypothetical protein
VINIVFQLFKHAVDGFFIETMNENVSPNRERHSIDGQFFVSVAVIAVRTFAGHDDKELAVEAGDGFYRIRANAASLAPNNTIVSENC